MSLWETDTGISKNSGCGETSTPPPQKKIKNHELRLEGIYAPEKGGATPP